MKISTHNKLGLTESTSKYPPCPAKPKKHGHRYKTVTKVCDYGLELSFNILPNKTTAIEFIYWMLWGYDFPWCDDKYRLQDYINDPAWYEEVMDAYENGDSIDPDSSTWLQFDDGKYVNIEDSGVKGAIQAYRGAYKIDEIYHTNACDCTLYGGYVYYDEHYGDWRATLDANEINDFDERNWKTIGKTWIEEFANV